MAERLFASGPVLKDLLIKACIPCKDSVIRLNISSLTLKRLTIGVETDGENYIGHKVMVIWAPNLGPSRYRGLSEVYFKLSCVGEKQIPAPQVLLSFSEASQKSSSCLHSSEGAVHVTSLSNLLLDVLRRSCYNVIFHVSFVFFFFF